ncbi:hypothetical protein ACQR1G_14690 [Bradyrhizobium oligotrophicum]
MMTALEQSLVKLRGTQVDVSAEDAPDEIGAAAVGLKFSDGTILKAFYWRLIQDGRAVLSSFDHRQQYGLPTPIDATQEMSRLLHGTSCSDARFDRETADLILLFGNSIKLQILNFTAYEIWQIHFPDGSAEYSNYALS